MSPACVGIGRFSVPGHAGVNRVRFAGRVHGRQLGQGTYRVSVRTATGRVVRRITLIVVGGSAPSPQQLSLLRAANNCRGDTRETSSLAATSSTGLGQHPAQSLSQPQTEAAGIVAPPSPDLHSGVLASTVKKTADALRPLLVALLALSILLLGLASLPRVSVVDPRLNELLVRHRLEIATLGAAALVAVAVAFLLA